MKKFFSVLFGLSVLGSNVCFAQSQGSNTKDSDQTLRFEKDSERAVEETVIQKDGKTLRQMKSGKVRQRQGEARVGEIEDGEIDQISRRQKSWSLSSFGFGPYGSSSIGDSKVMYGFSYGHHWEVATTAELKADVLGVVNSKGSLWHGGLGMSYLPFTTSVSPLIGASLGFGYASGNQKNAGGFSGQINLGLRFFRLSETQMEIVANYTGVFDGGSPGVYGMQLRLLY